MCPSSPPVRGGAKTRLLRDFWHQCERGMPRRVTAVTVRGGIFP
jgi:hypothetical protein